MSGLRPARSIGRVMFSMAVSVGTRLKAWNTNPILSRRSRVSCFSESPLSSWSPMKTCPDVRVSRPATHCISVDLPEPDGPMMAVKTWAGKSVVTPSRARTSVSPLPYTLVASTDRAAVAAGAVVVAAGVIDLLDLGSMDSSSAHVPAHSCEAGPIRDNPVEEPAPPAPLCRCIQADANGQPEPGEMHPLPAGPAAPMQMDSQNPARCIRSQPVRRRRCKWKARTRRDASAPNRSGGADRRRRQPGRSSSPPPAITGEPW